MREALKRFGWGFLGAVAGLLMLLLMLHLYNDHMLIHQAIQWINSVNPKIVKLPQ